MREEERSDCDGGKGDRGGLDVRRLSSSASSAYFWLVLLRDGGRGGEERRSERPTDVDV